MSSPFSRFNFLFYGWAFHAVRNILIHMVITFAAWFKGCCCCRDCPGCERTCIYRTRHVCPCVVRYISVSPTLLTIHSSATCWTGLYLLQHFIFSVISSAFHGVSLCWVKFYCFGFLMDWAGLELWVYAWKLESVSMRNSFRSFLICCEDLGILRIYAIPINLITEILVEYIP